MKRLKKRNKNLRMAFTIYNNVGEILLWETQIEVCKQNLLLKVPQGNNMTVPPHFCGRKLNNTIGCSFFCNL